VRRELSRKGIKLDLLRNEYKAEHPDGYAYTWFCTRNPLHTVGERFVSDLGSDARARREAVR
jgi:hypothetical protein